MTSRYEVGGVLEDSRMILLNEPLPCKKGPVKVVIETLQPEGTHLPEPRGLGSPGSPYTWERIPFVICHC